MKYYKDRATNLKNFENHSVRNLYGKVLSPLTINRCLILASKGNSSEISRLEKRLLAGRWRGSGGNLDRDLLDLGR